MSERHLKWMMMTIGPLARSAAERRVSNDGVDKKVSQILARIGLAK